MPRTSTGQVGVQSLRDRLRLFWSFAGKRYFLYLSLVDNRVNRLAAEQKAKQIEMDMATGNFDPTLAKYRSQHQTLEQITVVDLFTRFMEAKARQVHDRTLHKYKACHGHLNRFFGDRTAASISEKDAEKFKQHLSGLDPLTSKNYFTLIKGCWNWAIAQNILNTKSPWDEVLIRVPPKQRPKPLQKEEVRRILEAFRSHKSFSHYADFVEFLLSTGVRTGEAIGLKWSHISDDCKQVWIGESFSRGVQKETKTNKDRVLVLTSHLQEMMQRRRAEVKNDLVFPAPQGGPISDIDFRRRQWKTILELAGVPYRKPYITRSTMISHALSQGINPVEVAELTGHEVEVLFKNYAGFIESKPKLPDLWG